MKELKSINNFLVSEISDTKDVTGGFGGFSRLASQVRSYFYPTADELVDSFLADPFEVGGSGRCGCH